MSTEQLVVALEARIRDFERNFQKASGTANRQFNRMERRAQQAGRRMENTLRSSTANINRLLGTLGVGLGLNEIRRMAEAWTDLTSRVNVAVASQEKGAAVMARLSQIARRTYSELGQTTEAFISNSQALRDLGYSTQTQLDYTEALNNALVVSGAKAQRAESVTNALAQAMALGELRGQQLNTVIASGGRVAQALADGLGVTVSELRTLGMQGRLTGDVIVNALTGQLQKLREEADSMPATISDAVVLLRNSLTEYIGKLNEAQGVTAVFADGIIAIADNMDTVAAAAASAAAVILSRYVPGLARAALAQAAMVATNPFLLLATAIGGATFALTAFGDEIHPVQGELANLHDYAAVAWDDIKSGISDAADTIKDTFLGAVNLIVDALGGAEVSMADLADFTVKAANTILNAFGLVYDTIVISFTKLPKAVAEAVLNAVNRLVAGVEAGLNTVIGGVNAAIGAINALGGHVGVTLGTIGTVELGRIRNAYEGAGEEAGRAYVDALRKATRDRIGEVLASMRERANLRAAEREAARLAADAEDGSVIDSTDTPRTPGSEAAKQNAFEREIARIQKRIASLKVEADARRNATGTLEEQERAVRRALMVQDLLNTAQEAGVEITDDVRDKINSLADAYSIAAEEARKLAEAQRESAQRAQELEDASKDALKGFVSDLINSKTPAEALLNALNRLSAKMLDMALDALWEGIFGPSRGNNIFSMAGQAFAPAARSVSAPVAIPAQTFAAPIGEVARQPLAPLADAASLGLRGTIDPAAITKAVQPAMDAVTTATTTAMADAAKRAAGSAMGDFNTLAPQIMADLQRDLGLTREQAAGIVGNFGAETGGFRHMQELNPLVKGSKGGLGWAQWTGMTDRNPRRRDFEAYASQQGLPVDSYAANYGNLLRELQGPESAALRHLRQQTTVEGSTMSFLDKFERAGIRHEDSRKRWGNRAFNLETEAPGINPMTTAGIDEATAKLAELGEAGQQAAGQIEQAKAASQQETAAKQQLATAQQQHAADTYQAGAEVQQAGTMAAEAGPQFLEAGSAIQQAAQQAQSAAPGMGGLGAGIGGLMGPLSQAIPGLGQFGGAVMQLVQQLLSGLGGSGVLGGLFGFADGGIIRGRGTGTSDSNLAMVSDGEFIVNAKATKKHRAMLEAINSGGVPAFAAGGIMGGGSFANTYAPSLNINVAGSGNARQDHRLADRIADQVDRALKANQPTDTFRRSQGQTLGQTARLLQRQGGRQS